MKKPIIIEKKIMYVMSMLFPLFYALMYLPIWDGKNLDIFNISALVPLIIQVIAFVLAVINCYNIFFKKRLVHETICFLSTLISALLFGFFGIFFVENLMGIPPIPLQH